MELHNFCSGDRSGIGVIPDPRGVALCIQYSYKLAANAAPYLCGVHKPCPLLREETVPAVRVVNSQFCLCTSLIPRPMIVVFGLGTRLTCTHAYKIRKWRSLQRTAATECCEWLLLTRVNLKQ